MRIPSLPVGLCFLLAAGCDSRQRCEKPDDCDSGFACVAGTCRAMCNADQDCEPAEACENGICQAVSSPGCHASNECTAPGPCEFVEQARCLAGNCVYEARLPGSSCDDGNLCTDGDVCDQHRACGGAARACRTPPPSECIATDTIFRTYASVGACEPITGECIYVPTDEPCVDCIIECLTCADHADCAPNGYCTNESICAQRVVDGGECTSIGNDACVSRYCDGTLCCSNGDCCDSAQDCPASYSATAVCADTGPDTECQGSRDVAACQSYVCASLPLDDDSACADIRHTCPDNFAPVVCTDEVSQVRPACASTCDDDGDCAAGYECHSQACTIPSGVGAPCTTDCATGLKCENDVCCVETGTTCCGEDADCAGGLQCENATASCHESCNDYDDSLCADPNDFCIDDACVDKLTAGTGCVHDGQCLTSHCGNDFCCADGDCCALPSDCPSGYALPSSCDDDGPGTLCQGARWDAVCDLNVCGSSVEADDSGCGGLVHPCTDNLAPIVCQSIADQPEAACPEECTTNGDECASGYVCIDGDCIDPVVTVEPVYPGLADWNDYVKNDNPGADVYHQDEVACDGTEVGLYDGACIHGGEKRKVVISTQTSCAGLTLTEDLGAFDWICQDNGAAGPVTFFSVGLRTDKPLGDLLDATAFRPNSVTVDRGGTLVAHSEPAVWGWTNPVVALPDNSAASRMTLDGAGTIYTFSGGLTSNGYNIDADGVAIVSLDGTSLSFGTSTSGNCTGDGEVGSGTQCLLAANSQSFLWLETNLDDGGSDTLEFLVLLVQVSFSRVRHVDTMWGSYALRLDQSDGNLVEGFSSTRANSRCIDLEDAHRNTLTDIYCYRAWLGIALGESHENVLDRIVSVRNTYAGISLHSASHNRLRRAVVVNNLSYGIRVTDDLGNPGANYNVLSDIVLAQTMWTENDGYGIIISRAYSTTATNILSVGNGSAGVWLGNSSNGTTISHATIINNNAYGLAFGGTMSRGTAVQVLTGNNDGMGISCYSNPSLDLIGWVLAAHNNSAGLSVQYGDHMTYTGHLWFGNNGWNPCYVGTPEVYPGLVNNTCTLSGTEGSSDYPAGETSDAIIHLGKDLTGTFVGPITTDDSANTSDNNGTSLYDDIDDWSQFESKYRVWGRNASYFPASGARDRCAAGETCRILDWRLRDTDVQVRNIHGALTDGAACPASAHGDEALDDRAELPFYAGINAIENVGDGLGDDDGTCEAGEECHNRFLVTALEVLGDTLGDDDGLCESNEACVYSPNVGAYQGEGDYTAHTCTFQDGAITGVTLYGCPVNGR